MNPEQLLQQELSAYEVMLSKAKRDLANSPEGRLAISKSNGSTQYQQVIGTERRYLRKGDNLAQALAQKRYATNASKLASKEIAMIKKELLGRPSILNALCSLCTTPPEASRSVAVKVVTKRGSRPLRTEPSPQLRALKELHAGYPPAWRQLIDPYVLPNNSYAEKWKSAARRDDLFPEECQFTTNTGDVVRSKSELIIANTLFERGIPFRYEQPMLLGDGSRIYPDFLLLCPSTHREIIWEHFGMMSEAEYCDKALSKLSAYAKNGLLIGHSFIATFESRTRPLDYASVGCALDSLFGTN